MTPELYHILLKNVILFSRPVQIAWLLKSTHAKKLYAYLAEIWDMLLLRRMCQSEIAYHDVTFTLECRGTNYRKSYGLRHRGGGGEGDKIILL